MCIRIPEQVNVFSEQPFWFRRTELILVCWRGKATFVFESFSLERDLAESGSLYTGYLKSFMVALCMAGAIFGGPFFFFFLVFMTEANPSLLPLPCGCSSTK